MLVIVRVPLALDDGGVRVTVRNFFSISRRFKLSDYNIQTVAMLF